MSRRVAITGLGCITPLGVDLHSFWGALLEGQSGVGPITLFDARRFPVRIAAEVSGWDGRQLGNDAHGWQQHPRQTQFVYAAARQAHQTAGLPDLSIDPRRVGVYLGCGETFYDFDKFMLAVQQAVIGEKFDSQKFIASAQQTWDAVAFENEQLHLPAAMLASIFGTEGPSTNCIAACATSTQVVGEAAQTIVRNDADVMLCGAGHSMIHPFGLTGFHRLSALSTREVPPASASAPFDRNRDGFVVGEGAAMLVLEELQLARRRGAQILGEVTGYGSAQDASHITDPHPGGRGAIASMRRALADAGLRPDQIDYINAHGTSTQANDRIETAAIKIVFGQDAYQIPISSTKSMIGHLTTAGGVVELVACLMSLATGTVHPTINYCERDPECDLDYVPNQARELRCRHILSNSFGFGGQTASIVVSRLER